jgi:hypothetical protein
MSTFYLLPPRAVLGRRLAATLGIAVPEGCARAWCDFADSLRDAIEKSGIYVIYRDDLPPDEELGRALADGCGAVPGDEVMEIRSDASLSTHRWHIGTHAD